MKVNKWDFERHEYDKIVIPNNYFVTTTDYGIPICHCVNCKELTSVENCYTSYQYQDDVGFGYLICEDCANKEWELRKRYQNGND